MVLPRMRHAALRAVEPRLGTDDHSGGSTGRGGPALVCAEPVAVRPHASRLGRHCRWPAAAPDLSPARGHLMSAASDALAARIRAMLGPRPDIEEKKMFGGIGFM